MSDEGTQGGGAQGGGIGGFVGLVLMAIGILWMTASGLCSAVVVASLVSEGVYAGELLSSGLMILLVGGFSLAIGFAFYAVGRILRPKT